MFALESKKKYIMKIYLVTLNVPGKAPEHFVCDDNTLSQVVSEHISEGVLLVSEIKNCLTSK